MPTITPNDFLKLTLDPLGAQLDSEGAPHVLVGFLPNHSALHITSNAPDNAAKAHALHQLANALHAHADDLARAPRGIILPGAMQ